MTHRINYLLVMATAAALAGCGGGGDSAPAATPGTGQTPGTGTGTTPGTGTSPVAASAVLATLSFTDAANWSSRATTATALQATPDASGNTAYVERRQSSVGGQVANWNTAGSPARQSDLHFNGTAWVACGLNAPNATTVANATGTFTSNSCDNDQVTQIQRTSTDISGKTLVSVITDARAAGNTNLSVGDNTAATLTATLAASVFPAGSVLLNQTNTPVSNAVGYYPGPSNFVTQYSAAVAAGGVASSQPAGTACNAPEFNGGVAPNSTTLESFISANPGTPCAFGAVTSFSYTNAGVTTTFVNPDPVNEAWANSTASIGTLGTAPVGTGVAPGYYTGNTRLRVAFKGTGTNPVTYYACKERFNNGSARNCTAIGTGSYTIATRGDGRILTLNSPPAQLDALTFNRVFVERGGRIYFGTEDKLVASTSARLNLPAANALLTQLGLPVINPDVPLALSRTSYAGNWLVSEARTPVETTLVRLASNGTSSCVDTNNAVTPATVQTTACVLTFTNLATGAFTLTTPGNNGTATGTFDFLTGAVSGTYSDPTATPPASGSFSGARQ